MAGGVPGGPAAFGLGLSVEDCFDRESRVAARPGAEDFHARMPPSGGSAAGGSHAAPRVPAGVRVGRQPGASSAPRLEQRAFRIGATTPVLDIEDMPA
jgi:hypothetical protein